MLRFSIFVIFFIWNIKLYSQEIIPNQIVLNPNEQPITFSKKTIDKWGGEGFQLNPKFKLKHAFYGGMPGNAFRNVGKWEISNDSLILSLKKNNLTRKYGYESIEQYMPIPLFYKLSDLKNEYSIKVQIIILNDGKLPSNYLIEMNTIFANYLREAEEEGIWLIEEKVEDINQHLGNYIANKGMFTSFELIK